MKRLLVFFAVVFAVSIFPLTAFADHDNDQGWKEHHERQWRHHEREWAEHDREWKEHREDRYWREAHAREWRDWYRWHKENDGEFHLHIEGDNFELDIDR